MSRSDNHRDTATAHCHPDCRCLLIQIVALYGDPGRHGSAASRPGAWTTWCRQWGWPGSARAPSASCAKTSTNRVGAFLDRPLIGEWPYLWLDATYLKQREAGRIVSVAAIIAVAAKTEGKREIVGLHIGPSEAETFWATFLKSMVRRGLHGVKLVISDAHEGLKAAIRRVVGASWQRRCASCVEVLFDLTDCRSGVVGVRRIEAVAIPLRGPGWVLLFARPRRAVEESLHRGLAEAPTALMWARVIVELHATRPTVLQSATR